MGVHAGPPCDCVANLHADSDPATDANAESYSNFGSHSHAAVAQGFDANASSDLVAD